MDGQLLEGGGNKAYPPLFLNKSKIPKYENNSINRSANIYINLIIKHIHKVFFYVSVFNNIKFT